jgi:hypothetical protein
VAFSVVTSLQLLEPFAKWNGKDITGAAILIKVRTSNSLAAPKYQTTDTV